MTDQPLSFGFQVPTGPTANGRIYPPDVMRKAIEQAEADGFQKLNIDFVEDDGKTPKRPVRIGGRLYVDPVSRVIGMRQADDGSLYCEVEITDPSSAVDRLAAIAREEETTPPPQQESSDA